MTAAASTLATYDWTCDEQAPGCALTATTTSAIPDTPVMPAGWAHMYINAQGVGTIDVDLCPNCYAPYAPIVSKFLADHPTGE